MASKVTKKLKTDSELVKCKNCRQDISKDKMFLHEGFCTRNNTFCEHCEKVFLNKDYIEHVKLIPKNLFKQKYVSSPNSQESKDTQQETLKQSSFTEENENISNTMMPVIPKPSLEIIQMPITELYKINEPIFVNESGQILSNKNKNGFILPYLGMNFRSSKLSEKIIDDIIDQGEIFKEHNTISQNCYDLQGLHNLLNRNNYKRNISNSMTIDYSRNLGERNISLGSSSKQNNLMEKINSPFSKTIEINKDDDSIKRQSTEKVPFNSKQNYSKFNSLSIKLNANNSQKLLNRKYNFFTFQGTSSKSPVNSRKVADNMKINPKRSIPLDKICKNTPKRKDNNDWDDDIEHIYYPTSKKEPKDSNSKRNSNRNKFKFYKLSEDKSKSILFQSEKRKTQEQLDEITCEYCKNKFVLRKYETHIQNCKERKKRASKILDIPKPKKKQITKKLESCIFEDIDEENGISAKKRETLNRNFNASSMNVLSSNCDNDNRTLIANQERQIYISQFKKDSQKLSLKKKLFASPIREEKDKKNFPEDSKRETLDKMKTGKLRKRLYNLSIDINPIDELNNRINSNKSLIHKKSTGSLKTGQIGSSICFNNNKVIFKFPKNKCVYNNSII